MGDVTVSLHPAGHILGSAQVRIEAGPGAARRTGTDLRAGEVWVVTGDYKRAADPTCRSFEPVPCHTLITESTFGLPVYRWPDPDHEIRALRAWWARNRERDRTSVLFAYSLGKAQRILASLGPGPAPILVHGAIRRLNPAYEAAGVELPPTRYADAESARETRGEALVVAPPSAGRSPWIRKFGDVSTAFASGWMRIRGTRRRRAADRGFVLSDHVDWPALLETVRESGAERVGVTHGYTAPTVRYLREQGLEAFVVPTRFEGEEGPAPDDEEESEDGGES
jgi:putative mRNA 3-end processing factor